MTARALAHALEVEVETLFPDVDGSWQE